MKTDQHPPKASRSAWRIALIYAVVGGIWILISDRLLTLFKNPSVVIWVSTLKGWLYVIATAWMLYALVKRDIASIQNFDQALRESEQHEKEFYRRTIKLATDGKLIITEKPEIESVAGSPIKTWEIQGGENLSIIRNGAAQIAKEAGMDGTRLFDFVLCVGEATTNAYKHAGGGAASIHRIRDGLIFVVADHGPGIKTLILPELALMRGFTTANSLGMGYKAMLFIADRIYLATDSNGTTIAIEMALHTKPKPTIPTYLPDTWSDENQFKKNQNPCYQKPAKYSKICYKRALRSSCIKLAYPLEYMCLCKSRKPSSVNDS